MEELASFSSWQMSYVSFFDAVIRLTLAATLALLVGADRQQKNKPVDYKAYMLVAISAALVAMMAMELASYTKMDFAKVIQSVVGGVGFLAAGVVIQSGDKTIGTATGASIWAVAIIGLACGLGFYLYAILATALVLIILLVANLPYPRIEKILSAADTNEHSSSS